MNFFSRTWRNVKAAVGRVFNRAIRRYMPSWSMPPARNTQEWLEMYGRSPLLGVVTKLAEDLSFKDGTLNYLGKMGEKVEVSDSHPFFEFWENPNPLPQFTKEALWQLFEIYHLLVGEAYMIIEKDFKGHPAEMWPVPPSWVYGTPSVEDPYYHVRLASGQFAKVHVDDMFVQMDLNPADPYGRGLGIAQGIADEIEIDEYAAAFQKRFFLNDGSPSTVIAVEGADLDQLDRMEAQWNDKHKNVNNSHRTAFVSGKVTVDKVSENMKDMDMVQGRVYLRNIVLEHFKMPKEIMGITENSNRATADAAQEIYAVNGLTPLLAKRQKAVNNLLVEYWGEELFFEFDNIIPRNKEFDKQVAIEGFAAGLLLQNEARELLDQEALEYGDVWYSAALFSYIKASEDPTNIESAVPRMDEGSSFYDLLSVEIDPETNIKRIKSRISHVDKRAIELMERSQRQQDRQAKAVLGRYYSKQNKSILASFSAVSVKQEYKGRSPLDYKPDDNLFSELKISLVEVEDPFKRAETIISFVEKFHGWNQDSEEIQKIISNIWEQSYTESRDIMDRLYDLQNIYKPESRDVFKRMGGKKISNDITDTTKESIVKIIDKGLEEGLGIEEIAKHIGESPELSPARAELIAKQETGNALSVSNYDAMTDNGIRRHKWVTRGDGVVRPEHRRMNGEVVEVGQPFSNGLLYPRDTNATDLQEVMGCRCLDLPVRERSLSS